MGNEQSILTKNGYVLQKEMKNAVVATKGNDTFFIKKIILDQKSRNAVSVLSSEIKILKTVSHPHIVSSKNSFKDQNTYYIVMDCCQGGTLAAKIREMSQPPKESQVLSWIVETCMALRTIHEKGLLHNNLTPEDVLLTESGLVCLGGFGKVHENLNHTQSITNSKLHYLAPEVFTEGTYDAKSDIWSVGCILYELCNQKFAFSAETAIKLIPKILGGLTPSLPEQFSPDLCQLLKDMLNKDPQSRPTASEVLGRPFIINCLSEKCKTTVDELQTMLEKLRGVADGLERVHQGTTIGSLTGGVIGAVGGITSIVGLILAPFTLGASLIVTGVGIGVGAVGGITAGASNITNMVNESSDRKAVQSILKSIEQKMTAVVAWVQQIGSSLQTLRTTCDLADTEDSQLNNDNLIRVGLRAGKGLGGIAELVRLIQVMNIGKIVAQASRAVRVAEVATGVLAGLFVAVDIFFIAMDAKEIHHIKQAKAAEEGRRTGSESVSETETNDLVPTSDQTDLSSSSLMTESDESGAQGKPSQNTTPIRSEIMKFARSIRQAADNLQKVLDELKSIISEIPSLGDEREGWREMQLM